MNETAGSQHNVNIQQEEPLFTVENSSVDAVINDRISLTENLISFETAKIQLKTLLGERAQVHKGERYGYFYKNGRLWAQGFKVPVGDMFRTPLFSPECAFPDRTRAEVSAMDQVEDRMREAPDGTIFIGISPTSQNLSDKPATMLTLGVKKGKHIHCLPMTIPEENAATSFSNAKKLACSFDSELYGDAEKPEDIIEKPFFILPAQPGKRRSLDEEVVLQQLFNELDLRVLSIIGQDSLYARLRADEATKREALFQRTWEYLIEYGFIDSYLGIAHTKSDPMSELDFFEKFNVILNLQSKALSSHENGMSLESLQDIFEGVDARTLTFEPELNLGNEVGLVSFATLPAEVQAHYKKKAHEFDEEQKKQQTSPNAERPDSRLVANISAIIPAPSIQNPSEDKDDITFAHFEGGVIPVLSTVFNKPLRIVPLGSQGQYSAGILSEATLISTQKVESFSSSFPIYADAEVQQDEAGTLTGESSSDKPDKPPMLEGIAVQTIVIAALALPSPISTVYLQEQHPWVSTKNIAGVRTTKTNVIQFVKVSDSAAGSKSISIKNHQSVSTSQSTDLIQRQGMNTVGETAHLEGVQPVVEEAIKPEVQKLKRIKKVEKEVKSRSKSAEKKQTKNQVATQRLEVISQQRVRKIAVSVVKDQKTTFVLGEPNIITTKTDLEKEKVKEYIKPRKQTSTAAQAKTVHSVPAGTKTVFTNASMHSQVSDPVQTFRKIQKTGWLTAQIEHEDDELKEMTKFGVRDTHSFHRFLRNLAQEERLVREWNAAEVAYLQSRGFEVQLDYKGTGSYLVMNTCSYQ